MARQGVVPAGSRVVSGGHPGSTWRARVSRQRFSALRLAIHLAPVRVANADRTEVLAVALFDLVAGAADVHGER